MKIWSLLPSATEILFALGLGDQVAGVTHECDHPPEVAKRPRVTYSFIDSSRPSRDIEGQMAARRESGLPLYRIDEERLRHEPPDLIVTQDLCPVCAVSPSDFVQHLETAGCRPSIVCLNPSTLDDALDSIRQVGQATAREPEAGRLVASLRLRLDRIRGAVAGQTRRRLLCLEWLDPPMPAGHWLPEMMALAGGDDGGLIEPGQPSRKLPWRQMLALQPEVIALMPCGFSAERAAREAAALASLDGWPKLAAVRNGNLFALNGNAYFSRPGPRLVDGVEILAHILHPQCWTKPAPPGSVLKLVSPPAGGSSVENWAPRFEAYAEGMTEAPPPAGIRTALTTFPDRYELPARPTAASPLVQDAYRQTQFLLTADLSLFERAMNLQLAIVAASAKTRSYQAAALLGFWSRVFAYLADACTLLARGSYVSCPPLLRAACDVLAAQKGVIGSGFRDYAEWLSRAMSMDRRRAALALDQGRFRAGSVLAEDERLGAVYRPASELAMTHFGSTALQTGPESSLRRLSIGFADNTFHLGWAELLMGWLLVLADLQLATVIDSGVFLVSKEVRQAQERLSGEMAAALANARRCHIREVNGRFLFNNFRRRSGSTPRRVML